MFDNTVRSENRMAHDLALDRVVSEKQTKIFVFFLLFPTGSFAVSIVL